jgi:putative DNA primase/helicase
MNDLASALDAVGVVLRRRTAGNHRAACPRCDHGPKDDALGVTIDSGGAAVWHCFRCAWAGGWRSREVMPERPARRNHGSHPAAKRHTRLSDYGQAIWRQSRFITPDSPPGLYLANRCCARPSNDVRWHADLWHPVARRTYPAIVALVTDIRTIEPISLHFTYLTPDGNDKAPVERPRLYLAGHRKQGGVVRLWPDEEVTKGLLVGEGLETTLSAARAFRPAWACLDAANLGAFPVISGIAALTILADDDEAGRHAADECSARWIAAGREARIWGR